MPVSPYYGQSGYVNRNYIRSNSGNSYVPMMDCVRYSSADTRGTGNAPDDSPASYFRSKYIIPEDGPASSYLAPKYTPSSKSPYQLTKISSSDNIADTGSVLDDTKIRKSPSTPSFLPGNTANIRKTFNAQESLSSSSLYTNSIPKYSDYSLGSSKESKLLDYRQPVERKFAGKYGGESSYANQYLARINMGRDVRPKEIDTRDINTTEKPANARWLKADPAKDDEGLISRNRQVVRLTIKREKNERQDPFTIKNKTLNTVAQRLLEKYQVTDKKPEPQAYQPTKRRLYQDSPKDETPEVKTASRPPLPSSFAATKTAKSVVPKDPPISKTSPKKPPEVPEAIKNVPGSPEEEKEVDAATILQRATTTAETKKELQTWKEVKDAIYAAVLHPDVDIESDEEMERLMKGDAESPDSSIKGKGMGECDKDSSDIGKGQAIIGQLKRFVKQQESVKCPSKKRPSAKDSRGSKKSRKSKEDKTDVKSKEDKPADKEKRGEENENLTLPTADFVSVNARNDVNKATKEDQLELATTTDSKTGDKEKTDETYTGRKQNTGKIGETKSSVKDKKVKTSKITNLTEKITKPDKSSLLSADLVLNSVESEEKENTKLKSPRTADKTAAESGKSETEKSRPSRADDGKGQGNNTLPSNVFKKKANVSLLSSDLVLNRVVPDEVKSGHTSDQTASENEITKTESVEKSTKDENEVTANKITSEIDERVISSLLSDASGRKMMKDEKGQTLDITSSKPDKKVKSSLLSADPVLNSVTSEENRETAGHKTKYENKETGRLKTTKEEKERSFDITSSKPDKKVKNSLLSTDLVLNSVTSEENKDTSSLTNLAKLRSKTSEDEASEKKEARDKKEQTKDIPSTKIPQIKKKVKKQTAVEDSSPEVPQPRVSRAGPPSRSTPEKQSAAQEKVSKSQERPDLDVTSEVNKKVSSTTPTTNTATTSDHQPNLTEAQTIKSIWEKEVECPGTEESSARDKKGRITAGRTTSGISDELETSKISEEPYLTQSHKDEKAAMEECAKDTRGADEGPQESCPTVSRREDNEKIQSGEIKEQIRERSGEARQEDRAKIKKIPIAVKLPEETQATKAEKNEVNKATKPSGIPRRKIEATAQEEPSKPTDTNQIKKETEDKPKFGKDDGEKSKPAEKTESGEESISAKVKDEQTLKDNEVKKDLEESSDALPVKKAIKRPRQIAPPPAPEKTIGNELLKARNILRRPVKQNAIGPADNKREDEANTIGVQTKKVWKKEVAHLVPQNQGDQFLQARNVLKKVVKVTKVENKEETVSEIPKPKKLVKKPGQSTQPDSGGEASQETRGRLLRKQRPNRSRSASSSSDDGSTVRKKAEKPKRLMKPRPPGAEKTPSPKVSPSGSPKTRGPEELPASVKESQDGISEEKPSSTKDKEGSTGQDPKLSACQSADSGYGSSPSTPQPTPTVPEVKDEETCTVCGTNCHKKCEKQMPNLCGVNQKLLAEALSSVKKGGSADGSTRPLASPGKASSSVCGSEGETTEEETDTTDTDSSTDYFGLPEIRPPLQTCPKFKKYNVEDFNFIKVLGKGSYGKVMLAQQKNSENYFAVKCLKKDVVLEDNDVECTLIERKVLSLGTKHPYLCHLFCTFQTQSHLFFVMEYLTGGDLMFHIQHCGRFDEFRACFYAAEITSGLKFLHNKGIIYRDLKLDNILLDYQGHIRIADFGMCKLQVYLDRYADTFCGTPDYMAPEVIKGQHYNQCVDWWSFGVLLYEMLTGKSPFKGCDEDHLFWLICNDEPFFPKFLSKEATSILKQLLDKDSTKRLGIPFSPYGEIKVHPFFKYIDWNKIERKEVETPYKPRLRHILDVQYFDPLFTKRHAAITPLDESILATMDQTAFKEFSYTNPNITD